MICSPTATSSVPMICSTPSPKRSRIRRSTSLRRRSRGRRTRSSSPKQTSKRSTRAISRAPAPAPVAPAIIEDEDALIPMPEDDLFADGDQLGSDDLLDAESEAITHPEVVVAAPKIARPADEVELSEADLEALDTSDLARSGARTRGPGDHRRRRRADPDARG